MKLFKPNEEILSILRRKILKEDLSSIYAHFQNNYGNAYRNRSDGFFLTEKESLQCLSLENDTPGLVGIDLPTTFSSGKGDKTVFFLAQDPLRSRSDFNDDRKIIVGTPFGLHARHYREGRENFYTKIVEGLCGHIRNLYLTDIYKVWMEDGRGMDKTLGDSLFVLEAEIAILRPDAIIAFGNHAQDAVRRLGYDYIGIPHPRARASDWISFGAQSGKHEDIRNRIIEVVLAHLD